MSKKVYFIKRTPVKLTTKGWEYVESTHGPVKIMVEVDGYLMVRFPRATPFVISEKDLTDEPPP